MAMLIARVYIILVVNCGGAALAQPRTPEEYIVTGPCTRRIASRRQLVFSTSSSYDVTIDTIYVSSEGSPEVVSQQHVITNTTVARITLPAQSRCDRALTVHADDQIHVYAYVLFQYETGGFSADAVRLRPVSQLGKKYVLVTPTGSNLRPRVFSQIAAVKNKTNVTATVPHTVSSHQDFVLPTSKSMTLHREGTKKIGRVELERLEVLTASVDLGTLSPLSKSISFTGIVVEADEPVAVESGSFRVSMSRDAEADLLWTGLEPVELWGWDHVTFPTPSDTPSAEDRYYIVAAEDATTVEVVGPTATSVYIPTAFSWQTVDLSTLRLHRLTSDKPVAVLKTALGSGLIDPYLVALTHRHRWSTTLTFAMPNGNELEDFLGSSDGLTFDLIVVTEAASTSSITVNGHGGSISWGPRISGGRPGADTLVGGRMELSVNTQLYVLSSVTGTSAMAAYVTVRHRTYPIGMCFAVGGEGFRVPRSDPVTDSSSSTASAATVTPTVPTTEQQPNTASGSFESTAALTIFSNINDHTYSHGPVSAYNKHSQELTTGVTKHGLSSDPSTSQEELSQYSTPWLITTPHLDTDIGSKVTSPSVGADSTARVEDGVSFSSTSLGTLGDITLKEKSTAAFITDSAVTRLSQSTEHETTTNMRKNDDSIHSDRQTNSPSSDPVTHVHPVSTVRQAAKAIHPVQACRCVKNRQQENFTPTQIKLKNAELTAAMDEIRANLTVLKNSTGLALRRKISAPDDRPTSAAMGSVAVVCLTLVLLAFVFLDLTSLVMWLRSRFCTASVMLPE